MALIAWMLFILCYGEDLPVAYFNVAEGYFAENGEGQGIGKGIAVNISASKGIAGIGHCTHGMGQYQLNAAKGNIGGYGGIGGKCTSGQVYGALAECSAEFAAADFAAFFHVVIFTKSSLACYKAVLQIVSVYSVPVKAVSVGAGGFGVVKNPGE